MADLIYTPIEFLKGVGPERGAVLKSELDIHTFWDLLNHFPFRYVDRSSYSKVGNLMDFEGAVQLKGRISGLTTAGHGRRKRYKALFTDDSGQIELVWFKGGAWLEKSIKPNALYRVYGKPQRYGNNWNIVHPEITDFSLVQHEKGLQPIYRTTEKLTAKGLHSKGIEKLTQKLIEDVNGKIQEILPRGVVENYKLFSRNQSYCQLHVPRSTKDIEKATFRLKLEELLFLQLEMLIRKHKNKSTIAGFTFLEVGKYFNTFYKEHIPFELTNAQKRVVKEIRMDMKSGEQMNRLLQGDVGSGKTLVALLCMLLAIDNGFQSTLMAPTEILARQHFKSISELLTPLGLEVALLTGSSKSKERRTLHEKLSNGEIAIIIGTHALIEPVVKFNNLGLVIIDEQHRFGVAQRAKLMKKNKIPPHVLVMTATPIPRTLAMTFYGDLDVSVIDELPPGRKPIKTVHYFESARLKVFDFMKKEIAIGRQVYIVYPLIEESETLDYKNLMEGYEAITRSFPRPAYQVSIVHGRMKPENKAFEMEQFEKGNTHIMVATTVIEVGVNVPNASVMIIESAEKFGLSQLHQLRGRVGRGAEKSYCILMSGEKISKEARKRLQTMTLTNDGFKIAETDMEIRGPGDIMGTQQSGLINFNLVDLSKDGRLVNFSRGLAQEILREDPNLEKNEYFLLRKELERILNTKPNWSKIA